MKKIAKKTNKQIQEELELGGFGDVFDQYQDEPILLLAPDSLKTTIIPSFGMLPVKHFSDEENILKLKTFEFSIAFIFAETPHKRVVSMLKSKGVVTVNINSLNKNADEILKEGFSDIVAFPIKDDEVDQLLLKYSENYTEDPHFEETFDEFFVTALEEIRTIQFFRKSDILRELNELIVNSPKKYHKSLKLCIKDVDQHNKDQFYKRIKEMIIK